MPNPLLNALFPKICISCKREGAHLCEDCFALLPIANTPSLLPRHSSLSGLFCAASYDHTLVKNVIHALKYQPFLKELATPLAYSMIAHFSLIDNPIFHPQGAKSVSSAQKPSSFILCPVPLHKKRLKWRGFNHTEEIAKVLSVTLSIPIHADMLLRTKNTPPQMTLTKKERINNMRGAFEIQNKQGLQDKKVLLLDDVYTTGATLEQAAHALKKSGANQVFGLVVARGS